MKKDCNKSEKINLSDQIAFQAMSSVKDSTYQEFIEHYNLTGDETRYVDYQTSDLDKNTIILCYDADEKKNLVLKQNQMFFLHCL